MIGAKLKIALLYDLWNEDPVAAAAQEEEATPAPKARKKVKVKKVRKEKTDREEIFEAFEEKLLPAADAFRPELVLISAGFDSRLGDPLGNFMLTDSDFADLTRLALGIARKHAGGRLISTLEGGYNLGGLASAAAAHVAALVE